MPVRSLSGLEPSSGLEPFPSSLPLPKLAASPADRARRITSRLRTVYVMGYGVGVQDISKKSTSLIYGATAGTGVMAGAFSQAITGAVLDSNGRDFVPVFLVAAVIQVVGGGLFLLWWDSERIFE